MATMTTESKHRRKVRPWVLLCGLLVVVGVGACSAAELEPLFSGPIPVTREGEATETLPGLQPAPSVTPSPVQKIGGPGTITPGAPAAFGEAGYTTLERMWARPTCDVNGIVSGYGGEGAKTIIPATATVKVSMRLVPNQDPEQIAASFAKYVAEIAPAGVTVEVENLHNANPVLVPRDSEMMQAGMRAIEAGFSAKPVFIREGGSIPIVGTFQECLKSPVLLLGYGLSTDNIHSPNEKFHLQNFWNGARTTAILMEVAAQG